MKSSYFPYIAAGLGLILLVAVSKGSTTNSDGDTLLPLLTLLLVSEFGFIVTAIGAYLGFRQIRSAGKTPAYIATTILCAVVSVCCLYLGIKLWPL